MNRLGTATWRQYPEWVRGPASVIGDEVVLDEARAERYHIHEPPDLVFDLAALLSDWDTIDPQKVVPFVRRYGLLWHGAEHLGTGGCRESLASWQEEVADLALCISLFIKLKESVEEGSAGPLRDAGIDPARVFKVKPSNDQEFVDQMSVFLAEVMCDKLEECTLGIQSSVAVDVRPKGPSIFFLLQRPPNLVAAAYAHLAHHIVNRAPIKECPGCGRMFIPESGKQKYHSPSCASTSRWRRWKEKQVN